MKKMKPSEELDDKYFSCPKNDVNIVLGNLNWKVGREAEFKRKIRRHGLHDTSNENGLRALNFSDEHIMVISSTLFPRNIMYKMTWTSPNKETFNRIDHVLIDSRHM